MKKLPLKANAAAIIESVGIFVNTLKDMQAISESESTKRYEMQQRTNYLIKKLENERELLEKTLTKEFEIRKENLDRFFHLLKDAKVVDSNEKLNLVLGSIVSTLENSPLDSLLRQKSTQPNEKPIIEI